MTSLLICAAVLVAAAQVYPRVVHAVHLAHITAFELPAPVLYVSEDASAIISDGGDVVVPLAPRHRA